MFDPSELSVKDARKLLPGLDLEGLEAGLQAELDGKHRSSLVTEFGRAIDALKTAEESEEAEEAEEVLVAPAHAPKAAPVVDSSISLDDWVRFPRHARRNWSRRADGRYEQK